MDSQKQTAGNGEAKDWEEWEDGARARAARSMVIERGWGYEQAQQDHGDRRGRGHEQEQQDHGDRLKRVEDRVDNQPQTPKPATTHRFEQHRPLRFLPPRPAYPTAHVPVHACGHTCGQALHTAAPSMPKSGAATHLTMSLSERNVRKMRICFEMRAIVSPEPLFWSGSIRIRISGTANRAMAPRTGLQ